MANEDQKAERFFDHLSRADRPTKLGAKWANRATRRLFALANPSPRSRVLEIGPGRGDFADLCLAQEMDYHAIEPNAVLAVALSERGAQVTCGRVPPLPSVEGEFELVVMISVMEHMSGMEQALEVAQQVRDVLKPGGKFLIHTPDYLSWRSHFFNCDFSHNYVTTRRRLSQLLLNAGYENIQGSYMAGPFSGAGCLFLSAVASRFPFGALEAIWPDSGMIGKLYKIQLTLSRRVVLVAQNPETK